MSSPKGFSGLDVKHHPILQNIILLPQEQLLLLQIPPGSSVPKYEIYTWDHRPGVSSHAMGDHIYYMSKEAVGFACWRGVQGHMEHSATVSPAHMYLRTRCSWGTDCRAVGQECVDGSPEGRKGSSSSTTV